MPNVDFYTIAQTTETDRLVFACRLIEKAFGRGHLIYVHMDSEDQAQELDTLLWEFNPEAFIPHAIDGLIDDEDVPVVIGYGGDHNGPKDVLVNLGKDIPPFHADFNRITEIVINEESAKQTSREHWKTYKEAGYELKHHQL